MMRCSCPGIPGIIVALMACAVGIVGAAPAAAQTAQAARSATPGPQAAARFGLGRPATPDEIRRLDIDVTPDGHGLPDGRGTITEGAVIYAARCAACHGKQGEGATADRLVATDAGQDFAFGRDPSLARAIGNYWPYATTLYDYIARSMPLAQPGSLTANEVYGVVAFLLAQNKIIDAAAVMDRTTLPKVVMPARDRFVRDNRTGGAVIR